MPMYFTRKRIVVFSILMLIILIIKVFSAFPLLVEKYYSGGVYIAISRFQRFLTGWLPVSFGDIFYGAVVLWLLVSIVKFFWNFKKKRYPLKNKLKSFSLNLLLIIGVVYIWFNLSWGLNYNRQPLLLHYENPVVVPEKGDLVKLMEIFSEKLWQNYIPATEERDLLNSNRYIYKESIAAYERLSEQNSAYTYSPASIKTSLFGFLGNFLGYTGYYNPFTGEAQVNTTIPEFAMPFVACHEIAHQLGWAKESEANFIGFLAATASDEPSFRYAAYFEMYFYTRRFLQRADTALVNQLDAGLPQAVKDDYNRRVAFYSSYANPVEKLIDDMYAGYLKANEQPSGKESYAEVVLLLLTKLKEEGGL